MPLELHSLAIGLAALAGGAIGLAVLLFARNRALRRTLRALHERAEALADRNWELKEAEERARSFLAAQGDVIVRRDADGLITYANDAFCALAGCSRREAELLLSQTWHAATHRPAPCRDPRPSLRRSSRIIP